MLVDAVAWTDLRWLSVVNIIARASAWRTGACYAHSMSAVVPIFVGDELLLRKPHACGANHWLVLRTGADFKLECAGCHHQIWLARAEAERRLKRFLARGPQGRARADSPADS